MTDAVSVPEDGPAQIGPVSLPVGQRIYGVPLPLSIRQRFGIADNSGRAVAWVTWRPMADAGEAWLALHEAQTTTGLVPVLIPLEMMSAKAASRKASASTGRRTSR